MLFLIVEQNLMFSRKWISGLSGHMREVMFVLWLFSFPQLGISSSKEMAAYSVFLTRLSSRHLFLLPNTWHILYGSLILLVFGILLKIKWLTILPLNKIPKYSNLGLYFLWVIFVNSDASEVHKRITWWTFLRSEYTLHLEHSISEGLDR